MWCGHIHTYLISLLMSAIPTIVLLLMLFQTFHSNAQITNLSSSCPPSSCGNLTDIRYPFRLTTDPAFCGHSNTTYFELECRDNRTILSTSSTRWFYVNGIYYKNYTIRLAVPGINVRNLSSCPYTTGRDDWPPFGHFYPNTVVAFIHCLSPVSSTTYMKAPFCGDQHKIFANSPVFYSYVMADKYAEALDLVESCTVDRVGWVSPLWHVKNSTSLGDVYDGLAYGFDLLYEVWVRNKSCWRGPFWFWQNTYSNGVYYFSYRRCCSQYLPDEQPTCVDYSLAVTIAIYTAATIVASIVLRFLIGIPLMIWFTVRTWQRRHLCMDKTVEEFLQGQQNLAPIQYTYSEIKKMTNNFVQKLGEGGCGTVYKGKLRSGPSVAIKMMEQSVATEDEFISEVATIGRIHHTNIVTLIGFCVERSKCALVYEFLPNGSLDRYIFNQESLGSHSLTYEKLFDIALGVARGIDYLHHGCNMQILHFDIKPHNILLDEKFNPKISDFGLAQSHPTDESFINLTAARGTVGYMAPEMFYKNSRGITYKADVYSFGMMLMEMASKRKNVNPLIDDASQVHFPSWAYDQLCSGKDIEIKDATEVESKMVKRMIIVALWCMQMRPSDRPAMNKVVEMLESELDPRMPPKPFVAPHAMAADDGISRTYTVECIEFNLTDN